MLCSNCGYENPREHRYCGMCGTPFPFRALTVPGAQSTLNFTSAPVEVAPPAVSEPVRPAPAEPETIAKEAALGPTFEAEPIERQVMVTQDSAVDEPPAVSIKEPTPHEGIVAVPEAPAVLAQEEAASLVRGEISPPEPPPVLESELHAEAAAPPSPTDSKPETALPEVVREHSAEPDAVPQEAVSAAPEVKSEPRQPAPRVVAMPPRRPAAAAPPEMTRQDMAKVHPPPDSLPITPPPASAGMPTFKEIAEASGPPAISPFEAPAEAHSAEDIELKEFVANFRWTPPAETSDELTMRSEVPVLDKEAPAEFHHPSFDDDVAPPPEAGPHPTGEEYYGPDGTAPRPRFLDLGGHPDREAAAGGGSFLGVSNAPSSVPQDESAGGSRRRWWLWGTVLALVTIFGGLGYLEGRAQSTHAFRGPVEFVRDEYNHLRQRLMPKTEPAAVVPDDRGAEPAKPGEPQPKTETSAQPATSQPETTEQNPPQTTPSNPTQPVKENPPASRMQTADADAEAVTRPADTTPPKPIEAPAPKPSTKAQPGQQELAKAMQASDAAATAAWLWKATSRGNPEAPVRLADMYIKGNGVPKSCEQALVLLRAAATKENAAARNRLAALYANGTCVGRDRVKAYQLMSSALAVDPTSEWAKENRQVLWNQMTPEQRAEAERLH